MNEFAIVRSLTLRIGRGIAATGGLATALAEWAQPHRDWLLGDGGGAEVLEWSALHEALAARGANDEPLPPVLALADDLARLLHFGVFDTALLRLMIAADRFPRVEALAALAARHGHDLPALLGELAGGEPHDAERMVRRSAVLRLGLIGFRADRAGVVSVDVRWTLEKVLDRAPGSGPGLIELLIGRRQPATLALDDFAHVGEVEFLVRLLAGALRESAGGINVLIHGPPGTGKTELAKLLAAQANAPLHAIGEVDEDGEEPSRWDRVFALQLAQRVLGGRGGAVLLFDEMEDMIGNAQRSGGDWFAKREGSKVFVNRLLESNAVPVIWTTNALGNIDDAILRRMSFVL